MKSVRGKYPNGTQEDMKGSKVEVLKGVGN